MEKGKRMKRNLKLDALYDKQEMLIGKLVENQIDIYTEFDKELESEKRNKHK